MAKPAFVVQPVDASYVTGSSVNILLNVAGGRGMTYEWFKDGASIGTTRSNKLSLKKVKASNHDGIYSVTVTNQVGEVTSDDFSVIIIRSVSITKDASLCIGVVENQAGNLTVVASGGGTLAYQWQKYESKKKSGIM